MINGLWTDWVIKCTYLLQPDRVGATRRGLLWRGQGGLRDSYCSAGGFQWHSNVFFTNGSLSYQKCGVGLSNLKNAWNGLGEFCYHPLIKLTKEV